MDLAYPTLVTDVLPWYLQGLFLVVLLGAVFSSFNALINSAATMFALDIVKPIRPMISDKKLLLLSKWFSAFLAFISFFISPLLMLAPDGLWDLIRRFTGFFNIPIITIVLIGIFAKNVPSIAAKIVIIFHVITYYMILWGTRHIFGINLDISYIHVYGILFVAELVIMLVIGKLYPMSKPWSFKPNAMVEMKPWKHALSISVVLLGLMVGFYLVFSPIGLAYENGIVSPLFIPSLLILITATTLLSYLSIKLWNKKYSTYVHKETYISGKQNNNQTNIR